MARWAGGRAAVLGLVAAAAVAVVRAPGPAPWLVWNLSASVPTGLYRVGPPSPPAVGMVVVAWPPAPLAAFLAERRYLPRGVPLIKPVLAVAGQTVCRTGVVVSVDGRAVGAARARDGGGRPLPAWAGCRVIAADEVFLMNPAAPASFDGRYFGGMPVAAIVGRAEPVFVAAAGD